jgi:hypothetical protein
MVVEVSCDCGGDGGGVLGVVPCGGGGGGGQPVGAVLDFFYENAFVKSYLFSPHTCARGFDMALGKEPFAGKIAPRALCRELALGKGCVERNKPFANKMPPLGKGSKSRSNIHSKR